MEETREPSWYVGPMVVTVLGAECRQGLWGLSQAKVYFLTYLCPATIQVAPLAY